MKKRVSAFCAFLLSFIVIITFATPVFAKNNVKTIDVNVVISDNGAMHITQTWNGDFSDMDSTESYIILKDSGFLTVSDFSVSDTTTQYDYIGDWDVNANFDEKAYKCGINKKDDGFELCWGISERRENQYKIEYTLSNAVGAYSDYDGVNFRYINDKMSIFPTNVDLNITLENGTPITDDICGIWAFGFKGNVLFEGGKIHAYTDSPLKENNHFTVMFALNKGIISPVRTQNESFEKVKQAAFEGSDYGDNQSPFEKAMIIIITILVISAILGVIIFVCVSYFMRKKEINDFKKNCEYFRGTPNNSDITASYKLGMLFNICSDGSIIGALMLKLINAGCLAPLKEEKIGFFGHASQEISMQLLHPPTQSQSLEAYLFDILRHSAGQDGVLQEKELERAFEHNPQVLRNFITQCENAGNAYITNAGCFKKACVGRIKELSQAGRKELGEIMGLQKYLLEFSLIAEREVSEIFVWQDYMTYAVLFGIADKVISQLKEIYPQNLPQFEVYERNCYLAYHYNTLSYAAMHRAEMAQQARTSGSGGSSSMGGGGGSSGGSSGGGSR